MVSRQKKDVEGWVKRKHNRSKSLSERGEVIFYVTCILYGFSTIESSTLQEKEDLKYNCLFHPESNWA